MVIPRSRSKLMESIAGSCGISATTWSSHDRYEQITATFRSLLRSKDVTVAAEDGAAAEAAENSRGTKHAFRR